ncbi:hypothetical protein ACFXDP_34660, partial [Streptomyces sp. NPDC059374]
MSENGNSPAGAGGSSPSAGPAAPTLPHSQLRSSGGTPVAPRNDGPQPGGSSFHEMWRELRPIGRHPDSGGYRRYAWTGADLECRDWFEEQARARGLAYEVDRNGNQWAWLGDPPPGGPLGTPGPQVSQRPRRGAAGPPPRGWSVERGARVGG